MRLKVERVLLAAVVLLCVCSFAISASEPVALKRSGDHIDVLVGGRLFTRANNFDSQLIHHGRALCPKIRK